MCTSLRVDLAATCSVLILDGRISYQSIVYAGDVRFTDSLLY